MIRLFKRPVWLHAFALVVALGIMLLVAARWGSELAQWDERLSSKTWALSDSQATERRVVVVDIDEKSVQALGPWPWPRDRVASLLNALNAYGAQLQVLDILFDGAQPQDGVLAAALARSPTVVGQLFALNTSVPVLSGQPAGALALPAASAESLACTQAGGHMAPPADLASAATGVGHITPLVDSDGTVRRVPAVVCYQGRAYPALALAALAAGTRSAPQMLTPGTWAGPARVLEVGGIQLPVDAQGQLRVSYAMPRSGFISISASDVLQGRVPAELLAGAWVLVGSTALGGGDSVPTPQAGVAGGVEVHAQLLSAALDGRTPFVPVWAPAWPWAAGAASVLLLLVALRLGGKRAGVVMPLAVVAVVAGLFAAHAVLLLHTHQWLVWGQSALFAVLAGTLLTGAEMLRVRFERERLFQNFSSYLPESAARKVALADPSAQVVAESRAATVLFIDLRNFSAYCDNHAPRAAATVLHRFYTSVEAVVVAHGGEVEQMVGDGIMAVWNGSTPCADHARRAVAAAPVIWKAAQEQLPLQGSREAPPLDIGVGLESGDVLVGSFGPAQRRVHTVMGEPVNVAGRLQALTSELGYPILVGPRAAAEAATGSAEVPNLKKLGTFLLEGLQQPRTVHCVPVDLGAGHLHLAYAAEADREVAHG